ncbi:Protein of unknown function [Pyronema omphalodes CBS 100304]|uniref:Uncharacterized protein n=1 Tax=Pyronema omphalodes (strain CBS 100304) TaxID=1076935 RepID=U4KTZ2_PYROM|nr:Protein of unknown function [Pyronema omphalodes CBS 100304]
MTQQPQTGMCVPQPALSALCTQYFKSYCQQQL